MKKSSSIEYVHNGFNVAAATAVALFPLVVAVVVVASFVCLDGL